MRLAAAIFGALLVIVAVRGTETDSAPRAGDGKGLWPLLKQDFEPGQQGNMLAWTVAILIVGGLGYVPGLKGVSTLLLAILVIAVLLGAIKRNPNLLSEAAQAVTQKAASNG